MQTTTELSLDVARNTAPPIVYAKQGDSESRFVNITLLENGKSYTLESGVTARIRALKPSDRSVFNNATVSDGKIIAELTEQTLAEEGFVISEISLYKDTSVLSTHYFYIKVERSAVSDTQIMSADEYKALTEALLEASNSVNLAVTAANKANIAASSANAATERANKAAEAVGEVIDGVAIKDSDTNMTYIAKLRIENGAPIAICEEL